MVRWCTHSIPYPRGQSHSASGPKNELLDVGAALVIEKSRPNWVSLSETLPSMPASWRADSAFQIYVARLGGLLQRGDAFAQVIERDGDTLGAHAASYAEGLIECIARHEAGGQALGQRRGFHPSSQPFPARQE